MRSQKYFNFSVCTKTFGGLEGLKKNDWGLEELKKKMSHETKEEESEMAPKQVEQRGPEWQYLTCRY